MQKPVNNRDAFRLILTLAGTKTNLAAELGVAKQLVSRWEEIPPKYLEKVCEFTTLPVDWVLPELEAAVSSLLGFPSALLLPELIRILHPDPKASPWSEPPSPKPPPRPLKSLKPSPLRPRTPRR